MNVLTTRGDVAGRTVPPAPPAAHSLRRTARLRLGLRVVIAIVATALFAIPLYLAVVNVFKTNGQILNDPAGLPAPFTIANIVDVVSGDGPDFWASLLNSFAIVIPTLIGVVALGSTLGYFLGRTQGWATRGLEAALLIGLMLPFQVLLLPLSIILRTVGLQGTHVGLILFNIAFYTPFAAFVYGRFVRSVPVDLEEAARLDGASQLRTFVSVVFPLMRPTTASVLIFVGVWVWNDFLNPLILLGSSKGATATTGIYLALGQFNTDFAVMFALTLLSVMPVLIFFFLMQNRFVEGLAAGAIKG